jgi:hypothetical protein
MGGGEGGGRERESETVSSKNTSPKRHQLVVPSNTAMDWTGKVMAMSDGTIEEY